VHPGLRARMAAVSGGGVERGRVSFGRLARVGVATVAVAVLVSVVFRRVALAVLLVSMVPDVLLLFLGSMPGTTVAGVLTLMTEHVAS